MVKMSNIIKKLDVSLSRLNPTFIDSIEELERENRIYREEVLRLESVVKGLIHILAEKTFPNKKLPPTSRK